MVEIWGGRQEGEISEGMAGSAHSWAWGTVAMEKWKDLAPLEFLLGQWRRPCVCVCVCVCVCMCV
jgi:hypothetical protein